MQRFHQTFLLNSGVGFSNKAPKAVSYCVSMAVSRIVAHPPAYLHRQCPPSDTVLFLNLTFHPKRYPNLSIRASLHEGKQQKNDLADKPHSVELRTSPNGVVSRDPIVLPRTYLYSIPCFLFFLFSVFLVAITISRFSRFNFQGLYLLQFPTVQAFVWHIRSLLAFRIA